MKWPSSEIVEQLPLPYRMWARYLRYGPKRGGNVDLNGNGVLGGGAYYRAIAALHARWGLAKQSRMVTLRERAKQYCMTIDLLDFESFNHTLDVWLYGSPESEFIRRNFGPGQVYVDVGANMGTLTLQAASSGGPESRVYAFEPQERALAALATSIHENAFRHVQTSSLIVTKSTEESLPFYVPSSGSGAGSLNQGHSSQHGRATRVFRNSISLDDFSAREQLQRLDILKVDVEGYEADIFEGGRQTLLRLRPVVLFEFDPGVLRRNRRNPHGSFDVLRACGYSKFHDIAEFIDGSIMPFTASGDHLSNVIAVP